MRTDDRAGHGGGQSRGGDSIGPPTVEIGAAVAEIQAKRDRTENSSENEIDALEREGAVR